MNPTCYNPRKENDVQKQQHRVIETKEAYKGTICFRRPLTKNSNPRKTEPAIFSGTLTGVVAANCSPNDEISTIAASITIANNIVGFIFSFSLS